MHMSDALISPAVGGTLWISALAVTRYSARRLEERHMDDLPLMGVAGAFVFAAQMINISIPGTGSSGHLGGGLLLAFLLGPEAAFLVMFAVLFIQATFFADGGLLALGCNVINMGFFPAFIAYPLVRRFFSRSGSTLPRFQIMGAAILAVELGAIGVVLETALSGFASLNWKPFLAAFLPIHLAIGMLEGFLTVAILSFLFRLRPELIPNPHTSAKSSWWSKSWIFLVLALGLAGIGSRYASQHPDGLEWALSKAHFSQESSVNFQEKTALFPDYHPRSSSDDSSSVAGILGVFITLLLLAGVTYYFKHRSANPPRKGP